MAAILQDFSDPDFSSRELKCNSSLNTKLMSAEPWSLSACFALIFYKISLIISLPHRVARATDSAPSQRCHNPDAPVRSHTAGDLATWLS